MASVSKDSAAWATSEVLVTDFSTTSRPSSAAASFARSTWTCEFVSPEL